MSGPTPLLESQFALSLLVWRTPVRSIAERPRTTKLGTINQIYFPFLFKPPFRCTQQDEIFLPTITSLCQGQYCLLIIQSLCAPTELREMQGNWGVGGRWFQTKWSTMQSRGGGGGEIRKNFSSLIHTIDLASQFPTYTSSPPYVSTVYQWKKKNQQ